MTTICPQEIHPDWTDPLTWICSHHHAHRIRLMWTEAVAHAENVLLGTFYSVTAMALVIKIKLN